MKTITLHEAQDRLPELAAEVEAGETIVVTREGRPSFELTPCRKKRGLNLAAGQAFLREIGVADAFPYVSEDFDEPLPEDFLLQPLPK